MTGKKQIAIVGAGGVGSTVASVLHEAYLDDVYFVASGERACVLRKEGRIVNGKALHLEVVEPLVTPRRADLILFAVKGEQLRQAMAEVRPLVHAHTIFLPLLNGIDARAHIAAVYPPGQVLFGFIVKVDATKTGHEVKSSPGVIMFGDAHNASHSANVRAVQEILQQSKQEYAIPENMLHALWWKFMINSSINPLSAVLRAPYGVFHQSNGIWTLMNEIAAEVIEVARHEGVILTNSDVERWHKILRELRPEGKTSMLQDVEARRQTEINYLSGRVCELGKKHGVPTPLSDLMAQCVRVMDAFKNN